MLASPFHFFHLGFTYSLVLLLIPPQILLSVFLFADIRTVHALG